MTEVARYGVELLTAKPESARTATLFASTAATPIARQNAPSVATSIAPASASPNDRRNAARTAALTANRSDRLHTTSPRRPPRSLPHRKDDTERTHDIHESPDAWPTCPTGSGRKSARCDYPNSHPQRPSSAAASTAPSASSASTSNGLRSQAIYRSDSVAHGTHGKSIRWTTKHTKHTKKITAFCAASALHAAITCYPAE
jgi:hypothetical protein